MPPHYPPHDWNEKKKCMEILLNYPRNEQPSSSELSLDV